MSQPTDMTISNQLMPQARTELNAILAALLSLNAGGSAPSYKVDHCLWLDISETPWVLKIWDGNDWIPFIEFSATSNKVNFINMTGGDARSEAANIAQIQDGDFNWLGTITGATNTLSASLSPAITAYKAGMEVWGIAAGAPTGAATLALNGLSAKAVQNRGAALIGNEWKSGDLVGFRYDGTQFQIINPAVLDENDMASNSALRPPSQKSVKAFVDGKASEFRRIPQKIKNEDYTLVLADGGGHIYRAQADTTARTWTIPANSAVAFSIGTAVTLVNDGGSEDVTIAITDDTLVDGDGNTGSRTLAPNGIATILKVTATRWKISGTGLS